MQDVGLIAQAKPEVLDKVNGDKAVDIISQIRGISPEMINSDEQVAQTRQQRAEAQAQAMQQQQMAQMAQTADQGASAEKQLAEAEATKGEE